MHVFMTVNTLYDIILTYILHTQIVTAYRSYISL